MTLVLILTTYFRFNSSYSHLYDGGGLFSFSPFDYVLNDILVLLVV